MNTRPYRARSGQVQYLPEMDSKEYLALSDNTGFCLFCGATAHGVEPDGRRYPCEMCCQPRVYGLEELLLMGLVRLIDGDAVLLEEE